MTSSEKFNSGVSSVKIQEQINQLSAAIESEQKKICRVKGPDADKADLLPKKLEEYTNMRGREFFFRYISSGRGYGPFTELIDGSVKYDLINGIGTNVLGHAHPLMIQANLEAALVDTVMCGNLQTYPDANEGAITLLNTVKDKSRLRHFWFAQSGGCSNDLALKLVWQKQAPKYNLIAFKRAFAGRTVATQDITDKPDFREGMPSLLNVHYAPHFDQRAANPKDSIQKTIAALDEIWKQAPDSFCAMMIEIVQGEAGFVFGPREFYVEIFKWAKARGIYVWVDEVQTFARTKQLFAFQAFELDEYVDIVTMAKACHMCGALFTPELNPRAGLIAGTFNGSIAAIRMGQKSIEYLTKGNFYGNNGIIASLERKFLEGLKNIAEGSGRGKIGYYGAIGSMISFEVGDSSKKVTNEFSKKLYDNGVIGFTAGQDPARMRFLLPVTIKDEHIKEIFEILEKTVIEFNF
ncbi:MAG: aminotransferase class III-fold pyridoxal phosphate-dependent enzyme [Oligoflexia bacterium]|nr:aminotransferase class III-fold pyridoxal phosphate-dependent enzyme [Oligoflexia bacterium]MBF0366124.1 aminotransferase class III-fold pyridoxal phosphate-dependent enzyme [Oligoflexia bacterium]